MTIPRTAPVRHRGRRGRCAPYKTAALMFAAALLPAASGARAAGTECAAPSWRVIYSHDADGRPTSGTKQALIDTVRRGYPLRMAWGVSLKSRDGRTRSVEQSADAAIVTIASTTDVVAQSHEHLAQSSYFDADQARFAPDSGLWRGLFSTTGRFEAVFTSRDGGKLLRRVQLQAAVGWFAFAPDPNCDTRRPLDLAVEGGTRLDGSSGR